MKVSLRSLSALFLLLVGREALAAGRVLVVDEGQGGGDYDDIGAAMAAAHDEDVLLVRPGAHPYSTFTVNGKAIQILGVGDSRPRTTRVLVENLAAGRYLSLSNLEIAGSGPSALQLRQSPGTIVIERCEVRALGGGSTRAPRAPAVPPRRPRWPGAEARGDGSAG